ncbi:MAG: hypothetical protein FJ026_05085 [Chloroflexi bacterium]|nr:hypothetical protein [Chloroflexota bacterium]
MSERIDLLRWKLLDNPCGLGLPLGWLLRSDVGEVVGSFLVVPQRFWVNGRQHIFLAASDSFVAPKARPGGLLLFREFDRLAVRHVLFSTSANQASAGLWQRTGAVPVAGSQSELSYFLRWDRVALYSLRSLTWRGWLRKLTRLSELLRGRLLVAFRSRNGESSVNISLEPAGDDLDLLESVWRSVALDQSVTAVRDVAYLRWRYWQAPEPKPELWLIQRFGEISGWLVLRRSRRKYYRSQLNVVDVIDLVCKLNPQQIVAIFREVVQTCTRSNDDVLVVRGLPDAYKDALIYFGCMPVNLGVPTWWYKDQGGVIPNGVSWHLVSADGDATF